MIPPTEQPAPRPPVTPEQLEAFLHKLLRCLVRGAIETWTEEQAEQAKAGEGA